MSTPRPERVSYRYTARTLGKKTAFLISAGFVAIVVFSAGRWSMGTPLSQRPVGPTGEWSWNMETEAVIWDDTMSQIMGVEPEDAPKTIEQALQYFHPRERAELREGLAEMRVAGEWWQEHSMSTHRMIRPNGTVILVVVRRPKFQGDVLTASAIFAGVLAMPLVPLTGPNKE